MATRKGRASFGREVYYILCIVVFMVSLIFSIWGPRGFGELKKAQRELEAHRERVDSLKQSNEDRTRVIQGLRSDKTALEKYAREKGYAREGEIIQQLPSEPAPPESKTRKPH